MDPKQEFNIEERSLYGKDIFNQDIIAVTREQYERDIGRLLQLTKQAVNNNPELDKEYNVSGQVRPTKEAYNDILEHPETHPIIDASIYRAQAEQLTKYAAVATGNKIGVEESFGESLKKYKKPVGVAAALVLGFSFASGCIGNGQPTETPEPTETQEPTESPTYTAPPTTTPTPTTTQPPTPNPVDEELEWGQDNGLSEEAIEYMRGLDYNEKISDDEKYVGKSFDELVNENISPNIIADLFNIVEEEGKPGIEYLTEISDTSFFRKMIENDVIENHEVKIIDKSFRYSILQEQLKQLNEKGAENFLDTYEVVLNKSKNGKTEPEKFLYGKIDEHLPEFTIGENGFLYYGKEKLFKVDDINLYVKWLSNDYDYSNYGRWWNDIKRDCDWKYSIGKEFSLCWSEFIDEETGIPWNTKYYSVKPIGTKHVKYSSTDAALRLVFDKFGLNGLGYEQLLDIYI